MPKERYVWGSREFKIPSQFLKELPKDLITSNVKPTQLSLSSSRNRVRALNNPDAAKKKKHQVTFNPAENWSVGDRVEHKTFGQGTITHILGSGKKMNVAVEFSGLGRKILDPTLSPMVKVD